MRTPRIQIMAMILENWHHSDNLAVVNSSAYISRSVDVLCRFHGLKCRRPHRSIETENVGLNLPIPVGCDF